MSMFHLTNEMPTTIETVIAMTVAVAAVTDIRRRRIYNALTFPALATGFALNGALNGGQGLFTATTGFLLASVLFLIPVAMGGMGAGDLKLMAALGALGGPIFGIWCVFFASIAGGLFAVATLVARKQFLNVTGGLVLAWYTQQPLRAESNIRIPYALPIAFGAVAAMTRF